MDNSKTMKVFFLVALCNLLAVEGFVPSPALSGKSTALNVQPKEEEKIMRQDLAERTSVVEDEEKYAVRDGPGVMPEIEEEASADVATISHQEESEGEKLMRRMEKLKRRRAYPFFLAEKGLEIAESLVPKQPSFPAKKEKIVVLGTGWGAVSFLKGVDTSLYDVTVISPRNYFLFTPMLGKQVI